LLEVSLPVEEFLVLHILALLSAEEKVGVLVEEMV